MTTATTETQKKPNPQVWYNPTFSPEHGVYVMLLVSFFTGAAAAQNWTVLTTLALVCAFFGFQAEHPLALQIKQRKSLKPRFLVWGGLYGGISLAIALYLYLTYPILLWIYLVAIAALILDAISAFHREQKSIFNEIITFAAVCLSAPFAYAVTNGTISNFAIGLWAINTLYFCSTIFSLKLRKPKTSSVVPGVVYHAIATLIIAFLYYFGWLFLPIALAFAIAILKFALIAWQQQLFTTIKIQYVAMLETACALTFMAIVALSLLPTRLTTF